MRVCSMDSDSNGCDKGTEEMLQVEAKEMEVGMHKKTEKIMTQENSSLAVLLFNFKLY